MSMPELTLLYAVVALSAGALLSPETAVVVCAGLVLGCNRSKPDGWHLSRGFLSSPQLVRSLQHEKKCSRLQVDGSERDWKLEKIVPSLP